MVYIPLNAVLRNIINFLRKLFIQLVNEFLLLHNQTTRESYRVPAGFSPQRYIIFADVHFNFIHYRPVIISSLPHTTVSTGTDIIGE
jgi:hypothetical protein